MKGVKEAAAWVDCRGRAVHEVLNALLPLCLEARARGLRPRILVRNLDRLADPVPRLLAALERLAGPIGARIVVVPPGP